MKEKSHFQPKKYSLIGLLGSITSIGRWHALRTFAMSQYDWNSSRKARRSLAFGRPVPWWPYSATTFVDQVVATDATVLEIGSGNSTLWWLERGNSVTAIETSDVWAESVRTSARNFAGLDLVVDPLTDFDPGILIKAFRKFDVLHIDHSGDRAEAIHSFLPYLSDNGIAIIDNSDRAEYQDAFQFFIDLGYSRLDFFGIGPINAFCWQTTVFYRVGSLQSQGRPQRFATVEY